MKKPLYIITILANCLFAFSQSPDKFSIQPAIEVDANFYKITLELKEGKDDDDYKQKDKVDLPVTFLFNNKFVTGKYTGSCIKIKVLYTDSKKEQSDKLYLPSGKGKFTSTLFSYDGDWQFGSFNGKGKVQWVNYEYEGDFVRGQFTGKGKMVYANGNIYEGDWLNNDRSNGYGKMIYKDGSIKDGLKGNQVHTYPFYQGNWLFELFNGKGKMTYTNGDTLNGIWNGLKFNGYGKLTYANGAIYEGNWKDGEKNGKGKLTKVNGEVLDGLFNMGLFTGKAKIRYENGTTYDGDYVDNKFQGYGTYTYKDGESYTGQWANNKYNGKGKSSYTNGDIYDGDFVDGKKQGNGTYTFKTGALYTGQWADNKYNGKGKLIYANGEIYEGDFLNGLRSGNGTFTYNILENMTDPNGNVVEDKFSIYIGQWANDVYNGKGKLNEYDGSEYEGDFVNGKKQGSGKSFNSGETYTGQWANDLYNGQGKLTLPNKTIQEGEFVAGVYQKEIEKCTIGDQIWMAVNLDVSKFRNGDVIYEAKTNEEWENAESNETPAWCYYQNDPKNGKKYGKLYNHFAVVDPRGLAPKGWHVPTDREWKNLFFYVEKDYFDVREKIKLLEEQGILNGTEYSGLNAKLKSIEDSKNRLAKKLKSKTDWEVTKYDNYNGLNSLGFNILPAGERSTMFDYLGNSATFWSADHDYERVSTFWISNDWSTTVSYEIDGTILSHGGLRGYGHSVRCIRDK
jgi:uncharacterized protein (TIGR02145 family)